MPNIVTSHDMVVWKKHRARIFSKCFEFCKKYSLPIITIPSLDSLDYTQKKVEKIVYIRLGDLIEPYCDWQELNNICKIKQKRLYVITDMFLDYQDLTNIKFFTFVELNGVFAVDSQMIKIESPSRLFNCFINRVESTRQSWFYFLEHHGLLDKGYVSFHLNNQKNYSIHQGKDLFDYIHTHYGLDQLPHFEKSYHALKNQVPYQNFKEIQNLLPYIEDSKYSLVLETCAADARIDQFHYSEKSFRAIQEPSIPILFTQTNGIKHLESLGFEMYLDYSTLDHLTWQERQQKLLKILIEDQIEYHQKKAVEIGLHNRQILKNMLLYASTDNYFDKFFTTILTD